MENWQKNIQEIVEIIDQCIKSGNDEALTLENLSKKLGYSEFYSSRKFNEISGMQLKDYLRFRKLAFALKELRDGQLGILQIAVKYGFSSHEAFTRAFKAAYGITPHEYREKPVPVVLRTILKPFDCYLIEEALKGVNIMKKNDASGDVKTYFVQIPAHKFLHIRNLESIGYCDFMEKQSKVPGCDLQTICGLLDSIKGKLDDNGGSECDASSGQLMAWINEPRGRICSWGIPLAEAYGVRLPADYSGPVPEQMILMDVPESEYIVFEHGPFNFQTEMESVESKIELSMKNFDWESSGYKLDLTPERVFYFYLDETRFFKYVRPVVKAK